MKTFFEHNSGMINMALVANVVHKKTDDDSLVLAFYLVSSATPPLVEVVYDSKESFDRAVKILRDNFLVETPKEEVVNAEAKEAKDGGDEENRETPDRGREGRQSNAGGEAGDGVPDSISGELDEKV